MLTINASAAFADAPPPPGNGRGEVSTQEWWSEQDAGWIGGAIGGAIGLIGATFGILAGLGRARQFVMVLAYATIAFGILSLAVGMMALSRGQPYHVYYPLLLIGGIVTLVFGINLPFVASRYRQQELQKMSALDS